MLREKYSNFWQFVLKYIKYSKNVTYNSMLGNIQIHMDSYIPYIHTLNIHANTHIYFINMGSYYFVNKGFSR